MASSETFSPGEEVDAEEKDDEVADAEAADEDEPSGTSAALESLLEESIKRRMDSSKSAASHDSGAPRSSAEPSMAREQKNF